MTEPTRLKAKATAILLANRAKREGRSNEARAEFARAAEFEEEVVRELAQAGRSDFLVNAISAISCWLEAENTQRALCAAGEALELADGKDLDEELVEELSQLAGRASERDAERWLTERSSSSMTEFEDPIALDPKNAPLLDDYRKQLERAEPILA